MLPFPLPLLLLFLLSGACHAALLCAGRAVAPRCAPPHMVTSDALSPSLAASALRFFLSSEATLSPTNGGVNNFVQYVETAEGERRVLRVYNNGGQTERVRYEHSVLRQLHEACEADPLPFAIPRYLPSLTTGESMMQLEDGNQCCMCELIPGALPKTSDPTPLGRAVGLLMKAMGALDVEALEGESCHPYFEIYQAHPTMDREKFYAYIEGPELDGCRAAMDTMTEEFKVCDAFIERALATGLPKQVIHGDLHYDNVLCDERTGEVTGLLDFEFCGLDWRAMEVAVCLSKYVGEDDPFPQVEAFLKGFAEHGQLTAEECRGLPDMINLRVMSNCVYFVGRAIAGEDSIDELTSRADMYAQRMVWVRDNRERIVDCILGALAAVRGRPADSPEGLASVVVPTRALSVATADAIAPSGFEWGPTF